MAKKYFSNLTSTYESTTTFEYTYADNGYLATILEIDDVGHIDEKKTIYYE